MLRQRLLSLMLRLVGVALGAAVFGLMVRWLERTPDAIAQADAIVVLGGEFPGRVHTAVELIEAGVAPELWITGDVSANGSSVTMADVESLEAKHRGVPYERQRLLATASTWEDGEQLRAFARERGARRLLVVTSWYHSRRAMCVFEVQFDSAETSVSYTPAVRSQLGPQSWWLFPKGWWVVVRELVAVAYYWPRYGVAPWSC